jgi:uncharacterized lipoprotein YehR (DUF1307 family)
MGRSILKKGFVGKLLLVLVAVMSIFALAPTSSVSAVSTTIPINVIYYGWQTSATEQAIINAHPEFYVGNSPAGPWRGNCNIGKFTAAGIKYFEYIDVAYVGYGTYARPIPTDLWSNLNYITAAAQAGAYGIFVDEVCDGVYSTPDYYYLQQIADKAHSLGLKVVFNTGSFAWADKLMDYCDYINSTENWQNAALSSSQSKWASRTWLLTYGVYDATTAANLTNAALSKGIRAHFATTAFASFPSYFSTYLSQITGYASSITPTIPTINIAPITGQQSVTFNSSPSGSEVWLDYSYKGKTPLTLNLVTGNHHIGFNLYGYNRNVPLEGDFAVGSTSLTVSGDLQVGQITTSSSTVVASTQTRVSFSSNQAGVEVWLDYSYKGTTPLTLTVSPGSHYMGFYKDGRTVSTNFSIPSGSSLNIYGDMLTGYSSIW